MQLVFVTQVLDRQDAVLGFVVRWVEGLARAASRVRVLALEVGDTTDLPPNVDWVELGREGAVRRYLRYRRAVRGAVREGFDGLLTHMVPRYSVVAGPWARRAGIPHFLWYTHKGVDRRLLRAIEQVDGVFTASAESMRVETPKKIVTGHGIDAAHFDVPRAHRDAAAFRILSVGRVTPAKDPLTVIEALGLLREDGVDVRLRWAGGALARGDDEYALMVRRSIEEKGLTQAVDFLGAVPYPEVPALYRDCDLFVNASRTGSVDKVVLEAMAASRPFVSCNESIPPLLDGALPGFADREDYAFRAGDPESLASAVRRWIGLDAGARADRAAALAQMVRSEHDVDVLMEQLVRTMEGGVS